MREQKELHGAELAAAVEAAKADVAAALAALNLTRETQVVEATNPQDVQPGETVL